jgi:hypothetical protein
VQGVSGLRRLELVVLRRGSSVRPAKRRAKKTVTRGIHISGSRLGGATRAHLGWCRGVAISGNGADQFDACMQRPGIRGQALSHFTFTTVSPREALRRAKGAHQSNWSLACISPWDPTVRDSGHRGAVDPSQRITITNEVELEDARLHCVTPSDEDSSAPTNGSQLAGEMRVRFARKDFSGALAVSPTALRCLWGGHGET